MYSNIANQIYTTLVKQDFRPFANNNDDLLNDDTISVSLLKYSGDTIYIISLLNTFKYSHETCMGRLQIERQNLKQQNKNANIRFINVFLCENNEKSYVYISNISTNILEELDEIYWSVYFVNDKLNIYCSELQPNKILGIEKVIKSTVKTNDKTNEPISHITIRAILSSPLKAKKHSVNFYMIIIFINIIAYLSVATSGGINTLNLLKHGAFSYNEIINNREFSRLFTSLFLHGNLSHLLSNMLTLYIFGRCLEITTSHINFLAVYFLSGLGANALLLLTPSTNIMVGASGCIFGVIGALMILTFYFKKSIFGLNSNTIFVIAFINLGISLAVPQISFMAHFYGFIIGIIIGFFYALDEEYKIK